MIAAALTPASTRAWQDVLTHIENELIAGDLLPGDHLPSERTLAAELGVGRSSVREALRVLEVLGLLRTQTGSGPGSGAIIIARPSGGMSSLIRLQVAAQGFRVDDVVSTRLILETAIAGQLAEACAVKVVAPDDRSDREPGDTGTRPHSAPDLEAAVEILAAMEATDPGEPTPEEFLALDAQFHYALAEAAGNEVIASMMTGLRNSIETYAIAGLPNLLSWRTTASRLKEEHRAIISAIRSGMATEARRVVDAHITGYYAEAGFGQPPRAEVGLPRTSPSPSEAGVPRTSPSPAPEPARTPASPQTGKTSIPSSSRTTAAPTKGPHHG